MKLFSKQLLARQNIRSIAVALGGVLALAVVSCGESASERTVFAVLYANADSTIERAGETMEARAGMVLKDSDLVVCGPSGPMDLQTSSGASIRLRPYSQVRVADLSAGLQLELDQGSLVARVDRQDSADTLRIGTPTAIAGVRGTTFTVSVDPEAGSEVVVHEGRVAMRPRVRSLEEYSAEEIQADPLLSQIDASLERQETIIEAEESGSMDPEAVALMERMDQQIAEYRADSVVGDEVQSDAEQAGQGSVNVRQAEISLRDEADVLTMVTIDRQMIERLEGADESESQELTQRLEQEYTANRDRGLNNLEERLSEEGVSSEADLRNRYDLLEVVHTTDGGRNSGAVVAQSGGVLVVHTANGVVRVPIDSIDYIDFMHF